MLIYERAFAGEPKSVLETMPHLTRGKNIMRSIHYVRKQALFSILFIYHWPIDLLHANKCIIQASLLTHDRKEHIQRLNFMSYSSNRLYVSDFLLLCIILSP